MGSIITYLRTRPKFYLAVPFPDFAEPISTVSEEHIAAASRKTHWMNSGAYNFASFLVAQNRIIEIDGKSNQRTFGFVRNIIGITLGEAWKPLHDGLDEAWEFREKLSANRPETSRAIERAPRRSGITPYATRNHK
jgi:hypothetical protein